jgi:alpha-ketoglutarate-dependent taurine dioxygenase
MLFTPLTPSFGVEIAGLDLAHDVADEDADHLRDAFARSSLLLFREQQLSPERQVALASLFGPVLEERGSKVGYVSNMRSDGIVPEGALAFHSDLAFTPEPLPGLCLHALDVPADGAPTMFVSARRAASDLSAELRRRVETKRAVNVYGFTLPYDRRMRERDLPPGSPVAQRPVIDRHPTSGAAVLTVNELHTDRIDGLPANESQALLDELFGVLYDPAHQYRHHWRVGDVLVWDNIVLQHGRPAFPVTEARTLQRVTIAERGTYDLVPNLDALLTS